jgi:hypothetical protein
MIVCVGCSWTYGYGISSEDTYPSILSKRLSVNVINAGHCGADIEYAIYSAKKLIDSYRPKLVLFQLSTLDRMTLGTDGYKNFLDEKHVSNVEEIYLEKNRVIGIGDNTKTKFAIGSYINKNKEKDLIESTIKASESEYESFIKILFENIIFSDYQFYKIKSNLQLLASYAKSVNSKVIFFRWLKSTPINELCDNMEYINHSVEDLSLDFIDNGYHLGSTGNALVIDRLILPYLKEHHGF